MKQIYISLLNYNANEDTLHCLQSIEKLHKKDFSLHVIVVDNASKVPFTAEKEEFKNFTLHVIYNKENTGFSGGHNSGIRYALDHGADYVMILNNDTVLDNKLVEELVAAAENDETVGITAPKIYFAKGHEFHKDRYTESELGKVFWYAGGIMDWANIIGKHRGVDEVDHGQYNTLEKTEYASGCCFLVKKDVFEKAGLFNELYFLYYEDADFNVRVKKTGYTVVYVPSAVMWHINAGSAGGSGSPLQEYYITRNRMLFGMSYASLRTKFALIRESVRLLVKGKRWQRQGIIDFYIGKFGKGSYGI